jgi:GAF domain-containing protein
MRLAENNMVLGRFGSAVMRDLAPSSASAADHLAFERMLADLSARFANVPAEKVEFEIQVAQTILRQFLGFDRSTFGELKEDGPLVVLSSTAVEGLEPTPQGPLPSQLSWFLAKLRAGEIFVVQSPNHDLPPEAAAEAEYIQRTGPYLQHAAQIRASQSLSSHSPSFLSVIEEVAQVAQTSSTVLLLGKPEAARRLWHRRSTTQVPEGIGR